MATASSSSPYYPIREEDHLNQLKQQQMLPEFLPPAPSMPSSSSVAMSAAANLQGAAPAKKKRNLPGNPNPDAEVIALSPKTLMATNRFICEVCNKGFQREQNLQLHRRGHNLPWKLKQKSSKEVRRRVYLCPEPTCVHHDPSRALGDLTGIKKHFCRKHGEKKWKCDKCSKRYAVQSDWKAHSKTCGTREYRCDCGTLFSRRDSFITHRAFCDALAQETARIPANLSGMASHLYAGGGNGLGLSQVNLFQNQIHPSADLLCLGAGSSSTPGSQFDHLIPSSHTSSFRPPPHASPSAAFFLGAGNSGPHFGSDDTQSQPSFLQNKPYHGLMQLPNLQPNSSASTAGDTANLYNLSFFSNGSSTSSNAGNHAAHRHHLMMQNQFTSSSAGESEPSNLYDQMGSGMQALFNSAPPNNSVLPQMSATALLQKAAQMGSTASNNSIGRSAGGGGSFFLRGIGSSSPPSTKPVGFADNQDLRSQVENHEKHLQDIMNSFANGNSGIFSGEHQEQEAKFADFKNAGFCNMDEASYHSNGLTRDFLGVGNMLRSMGGTMASQRGQHNGILDIGSLDPEVKPTSSSRSFASK